MAEDWRWAGTAKDSSVTGAGFGTTAASLALAPDDLLTTLTFFAIARFPHRLCGMQEKILGHLRGRPRRPPTAI